jgi:hypothetical protein
MVNGTVKDQLLPEPRAQVKKLMELLNVELPKKLHDTGRIVLTEKNLERSRLTRCK